MTEASEALYQMLILPEPGIAGHTFIEQLSRLVDVIESVAPRIMAAPGDAEGRLAIADFCAQAKNRLAIIKALVDEKKCPKSLDTRWLPG